MATLRPLFAQLGAIERSDGSAQISHGRTAAVAAVFGPGDVRAAKEKVDRAHVEVAYRGKAGHLSGVGDRATDEFIAGAVRAAALTALHPRTAVHVSVQQLEDDGGELAACVNAACLALVDAGVAMRFLFASVTAAIIENKVVLDASKREAAKADAVLTFVFESTKKDILSSHVEGRCSEAKFQECLGAATCAVDKVFDFYRECVRRKFSKEFA